MRVSAKAQYACIAMLELASNYQEPQLLQVKSIAESHGISPRFLVQILLQLKVHGLVRSLVANMVEGVDKGFTKHLELVGVGYRVAKQGEELVLNLGYSHPIRFKPPQGVTIDVQDPTKFSVSGVSIEDVGQVAANIRGLRPPEPYKGKGVMYRGERIRRKPGKAGKGAKATA